MRKIICLLKLFIGELAFQYTTEKCVKSMNGHHTEWAEEKVMSHM